MEYEPVIGLEVHVQLSTRSKMFCACAADYQSAEPNTRVCPVCLALPGTLPVVNRQAVEDAIMIGLALNCEVAPTTKFDRKNYPYPDLMKGYQISQYDVPICRKGWLEVPGANGDGPARIRINRVHMEEDVARLIHIAGPDGGPGHTLMDVNRAGTPLMEVVSEPDIRSPKQAGQYIETLQAIIRYLGVGTANMEEGSFRCDANVSVRPRGAAALGTRVEVKNMNRVRAVTRAIEHEIVRQTRVIEDGGRIVQETRGWDDVRGGTVPQRSKEEAHDYRYFPEPDIPPIVIGRDWVARVRARLPELPAARRARFQQQYGLSEYDTSLLTASRSVADYFEAVAVTHPVQQALDERGSRSDLDDLGGVHRPFKAVASVVSDTEDQDRRAFAKEAANWLNGEMARLLNEDGQDISAVRIKPGHLASLVEKFRKRDLNNATAKAVFEEMYRTGEDPEAIIKAKGLTKVADLSALGPIIEQVVSANKSAVADFLAGKEPALRFLVGQVMKSSRGQADAEVAVKLLRERLGALKAGR